MSQHGRCQVQGCARGTARDRAGAVSTESIRELTVIRVLENDQLHRVVGGTAAGSLDEHCGGIRRL